MKSSLNISPDATVEEENEAEEVETEKKDDSTKTESNDAVNDEL